MHRSFGRNTPGRERMRAVSRRREVPALPQLTPRIGRYQEKEHSSLNGIINGISVAKEDFMITWQAWIKGHRVTG